MLHSHIHCDTFILNRYAHSDLGSGALLHSCTLYCQNRSAAIRGLSAPIVLRIAASRAMKSFIRLILQSHMSYMWGNAGKENYWGDPHRNYGWQGSGSAAHAALAPSTKDDTLPGWRPESAQVIPLRKYVQQFKLWQYMIKVDDTAMVLLFSVNSVDLRNKSLKQRWMSEA